MRNYVAPAKARPRYCKRTWLGLDNEIFGISQISGLSQISQMKRFRKRKESAEELTDARHTDGGGAIDTLCHTKLSSRMPVSMRACGC